MLRQDDLHDKQLGTVASCELSGPANSVIGYFRAIGPDHDTSYGAVLRVIVHNF